MTIRIYPTDLTDKEWELISPLLPKDSPTGRPRELSLREVLNALFYFVKTGCQWRYLPKNYPVWSSVYYYWRKLLWMVTGKPSIAAYVRLLGSRLVVKRSLVLALSTAKVLKPPELVALNGAMMVARKSKATHRCGNAC